jgi:hypothetical protein
MNRWFVFSATVARQDDLPSSHVARSLQECKLLRSKNMSHVKSNLLFFLASVSCRCEDTQVMANNLRGRPGTGRHRASKQLTTFTALHLARSEISIREC